MAPQVIVDGRDLLGQPVDMAVEAIEHALSAPWSEQRGASIFLGDELLHELPTARQELLEGERRLVGHLGPRWLRGRRKVGDAPGVELVRLGQL
ncbi:hypothetical protein WMF36_42410 [Sorangium sp. So ce887]